MAVEHELGPVQKVSAPPVTAQDLYRVHSRSYVNGVLSGRFADGFGNESAEIAKSFLHTSGMMVEGVRLAVKGLSSCVPVSGFHHACWADGGGFCTFNGLALAAMAATDMGLRPGICDLDMHYGNGTVDVFKKTGYDCPHFTYGGSEYARCGNDPDKAAVRFLKYLPGLLDRLFEDCTVLLYQAGADPHVDDPLGGQLTTGQMLRRDRIVFDFCCRKGIPVVWDLAGGYQTPTHKVVDLHVTTFRQWVAANCTYLTN